jgi:glucose/arabinose dehydrogenase
LNRSSPEYPRFDCGKMHAPTMLLPPHAAPLGMLRYQGAGIPGLAGQLVIGYHGYRKLGHRIVAMPVAAIGRPRAKTHDVVWHWEAGAGMPQGAPVALAEMSDGSVLITEDQNGTLLRLTRQ